MFGRAIGQNQAIQHPLAQSWCALEAAKMLTLTAARRLVAPFWTEEAVQRFNFIASFDEVIGVRISDQGQNHSRAPDEDKAAAHAEVGALCNAAKYVSAEAAFEACERAGKCIISELLAQP